MDIRGEIVANPPPIWRPSFRTLIADKDSAISTQTFYPRHYHFGIYFILQVRTFTQAFFTLWGSRRQPLPMAPRLLRNLKNDHRCRRGGYPGGPGGPESCEKFK